jgi:Protein of unknown function DUF262/Protein of unknown function (DUF1524)
MTPQSIISQDLSLAEVFQSFYRVPDYQREYVWGEKDTKGERGDEVEQFLKDIFSEFEQATSADAPEYFIGTIVVCLGTDNVFDLIDGQQRTTTSFLTLCALRDALHDLETDIPSTLKSQIADGNTDWQGKTVQRMRLDLQYEDASGVLEEYGSGKAYEARSVGTRSIQNLADAYAAIREFLTDSFKDDPDGVSRFYGYFINKVKLIRIQTPSVSRALKIFETINDRGVGLDAMDLLKNLLFMNAKPNEFSKLKDVWRQLTQQIYDANEKPLRFLRYYIIASFDVDSKIREEDIYDWLTDNEKQTGHSTDPLAFATRLRDAAKDYGQFVRGNNVKGTLEHGIVNTRSLGGSAIKQHFVLLLAGRHLEATLFTRLCNQIEQVMFVWFIAGVPAKEYDRIIAQAARELRKVRKTASYDAFEKDYFENEKTKNSKEFQEAMEELFAWDLRKFRLRYLLAKVTQYFDIEAYGEKGRTALAHYLDTQNDIEHIMPENPDEDAIEEFGEGFDDEDLLNRLGNLMLIERSVNRVIQNCAYSVKREKYPTSQFLVARCQAELLKTGKTDQITRAMKMLDPAPKWNAKVIEKRQEWLADVALDIWGLR